MNDYLRQAQSIPAGRADMAVDAGLRSFMLGVFNKMALGLALTAAIAGVIYATPSLQQLLFGTPLRWVVMFGPIGILLISSFVMKNPSPMAAGLIYWSVVTLIGASMGALVMVYAGRPDGMLDVAKAFLTTSIAFGALSLWGYTTKKDLTGFGTFLIMGLIGLIVASIVNVVLPMFMGGYNPGPLSFAISVLGVLIFAGLTAFDTQRLKYTYFDLQGDARSLAVATTYGALSLYLNFINLFQFILSLMSSRD